MWYKEDSRGLDYEKPICCSGGGSKYILLPQIRKESHYEVCGYNWFNLVDGTYNSCFFYTTVEEAVVNCEGHEVFNVKLRAEKIQ